MAFNNGVVNLNRDNQALKVKEKSAMSKVKIGYNHYIIAVIIYIHLSAFYGIYFALTSVKWSTLIFMYIYGTLGGMGITAGAHRLWSHRAYKAKMPLQIILMLMQSAAGQFNAIHWIMEHRLHHRYTDTDADPHNAARGFYFSHIGWLTLNKHPDYLKSKVSLHMSDIYNNPVLQFQRRYSWPVISTMCFILPTLIIIYFFEESTNCAWHLTMLRYVSSLHVTFLVNSAAHMWGYKPYDKSISPTNNISVSIIAIGEGFHNYHHVFPWDYKTGELGNNYLNVTTWFIDFFAKIGWAYDLKSASEESIRLRKNRTGDGTNVWGWEWEDRNFTSEGEDTRLKPQQK